MAEDALTPTHSRRRTLRLVLGAVLALAGMLVLWRAWTLGSLAWQSAAAAQRLRAAAQGEDLAANLPQMAVDLNELAADLQALDAGLQPLAPLLGAPAAEVAAAAELAGATSESGQHLGWLLGADAPRTYLLVVQNNHELRATGGFIAAFGTLRVGDGKLAGLTFADSYDFFSTAHEYEAAPAPMQQYMGIQLLVPRDANWSPDLPTAAQTIRTLYTRETGQGVDGVVTLDLHAVRHLVAALGELHVDGVETPITAANLEQALIELWEQPLPAAEPAGSTSAAHTSAGTTAPDWWAHRKDFVGVVASAALARLQAGDYDLGTLAVELDAALENRSLQVWLDQPELQAALARRGWDGGLHPQPNTDFLAVVDSNVGYNKADAVIQRSASYAVAWEAGESAPAAATLTLTYTHPLAADDSLCDPAPRYGEGYADLIARCYFAYVRVYVPSGSRLLDVSGVDPETVTSAAGEQGTQVFGAYLVVPPAGTRSVSFTYLLPPTLQRDAYSLRVQRQAGTGALPLHLDVGNIQVAAVVEEGIWDWNSIP